MGSKITTACLTALAFALATPCAVSAYVYEFTHQLPQPPAADTPRSTYFVGEALYWAGGQADFNYAELGNIVLGNPPGFGGDNFQSNAVIEDLFSETIDSNYEWGFRVGAGREWNCYLLRAALTWWEGESHDRTVRGNNNSLTIPQLSFSAGQVTGFQIAKASLLNKALMSEVHFGLIGNNTCRGHWEVYGVVGTHYLGFRNRVEGYGVMDMVEPPTPNVPILGQYTVGFDQYGFALGGGFRGVANLLCGFSLAGGLHATGTFSHVGGDFLNYSLTPARNRLNAVQVGFYEEVDSTIRSESRTCMYLGYHGNVGLHYKHQLCGCTLEGAVRYEVYNFKLNFYSGPTLFLAYHW